MNESPVSNSPVTIRPDPERGGCYVLETELWVQQSPEEVFPFYADAGNLEAITPPWLQFKVMTPTPFEMHAGQIIDYRLRLHGVPIKWRTEISVWEPSVRFVDRQIRGPYRYWIHEHTFVPLRGGTLVRDQVRYAAWCGWLAQGLLVRRDLEQIFSFRQQILTDVAARNSWQETAAR